MTSIESSALLLIDIQSDGVAVVRLNRPEVRNALNLALRRELAEVFAELAGKKSVRCIVLTGDERAFCAGADLNEYVEATPTEIIERDMHRLWGAIAECPTPVIAAVNGYALGGGCELAMHADIIIAGTSASFGQPEIRIGLIPGGGATQRLTWAVGKFRAMHWLLTGDPLDAETAYTAGLVSQVVPDAEVQSAAIGIARTIAGHSPLAARQIKELVLESMNVPLDSGLRVERKAFQLMFSSTEKTDRIREFLSRKKPSNPRSHISTPINKD